MIKKELAKYNESPSQSGDQIHFSSKLILSFVVFLILVISPPIFLIKLNHSLPVDEIIFTYISQWMILFWPATAGGIIGEHFKRGFEGALIGLAIWMFGAYTISTSLH